MDTGLWKQRAEDDGLACARSRTLEVLLTAYVEGSLGVLVPVGSTVGTVEREGCRVYLEGSMGERARDQVEFPVKCVCSGWVPRIW